MDKSLSDNYQQKSQSYFSNARQEMIPFVPISCRTILDVGCGAGTFGEQLKARSTCTVWGVEPNPQSIPLASRSLDRVFNGTFDANLNLPTDHFDCIIFNDVLEHVIDPDSMLQYATRLLTRNGRIVASIPNIGHFPTVWNLAFNGNWEYTSHGILDVTHLRFYTRNSIARLFSRNNLTIQTIAGINPYFNMQPGDSRIWRRYRFLAWLRKPGIHDMRYLQFAVVAGKP